MQNGGNSMKKLSKKILSVFFVVAIVLSATLIGIAATEIRAVSETAAIADGYYDTEYYYASGTQFISELAIGAREYRATSSGRENAAKEYLTNAGYTLLGKDLNDGINGYFIHMGYKTSTNASTAIRAIAFYNGATAPATVTYNINGHNCTFYPVTTSFVDNSTSSGSAFDLNTGVGGDWIYMYYTKDPNAGPPITAIEYSYQSSVSGLTVCPWINTGGTGQKNQPADLNAGNSGDYIYICYSTLNTPGSDVSGEHFPAGYDPLLDKYGFTNPSQVVESKIYKTVYGTVKGSWLSFLHENGKAHGLCYGMASTTAALLQNRSAINSFSLLSPDMNLGNVEFISSIFESGYSSVLNMDALTFIKYGYVYQFASERDSSINNLRNLYSVVKSYVDGNGSCVVISIYHGTKNNRKHGHAILATGIKETNNEYIILIDDSNFLEQTELSISKDFSTWRYLVDGVTLSDGTPYNYNSSNGIIAYDFPGSVVYNLGLLAGAKTRTATNYLNENRLLVTSTSSLGENDNLSEIFVTEESDLATNDSLKLYWIAEDMNGIELSAENNNSEITVSDVNSSVSVVLDSKENASFYVDDDKTNKVSYLSEKDENASVVFSSVDEKGEIVKTTLTGTANGDEVVASETGDGIQVTGLNDITVTYETADGTAETKADVKDGSTVNITVNDDENKVETDWQCKHSDTDHNGICDNCGKDFTADCGHSCHSNNAFVQFFYKIARFFWKLFGMKQYQYCDCGKAHW